MSINGIDNQFAIHVFKHIRLSRVVGFDGLQVGNRVRGFFIERENMATARVGGRSS